MTLRRLFLISSTATPFYVLAGSSLSFNDLFKSLPPHTLMEALASALWLAVSQVYHTTWQRVVLNTNYLLDELIDIQAAHLSTILASVGRQDIFLFSCLLVCPLSNR